MNKKISDFLSKKITYVNFIMTFFVVVIHFSSQSRLYSGTNIFVKNCLDYFGQGITRNAVPLFFIISGILLFWYVNSMSDLKNKLIKRLKSLVIPYFIWNILSYIFNLIISRFGSEPIKFNYIDCFKSIFIYKYNGPFWYVLFLIAYVMISPLIYKVINTKKFFWIGFVVLIALYFIQIYFLKWFVFFYFGCGLALFYKDLINHQSYFPLRWLALLCFIMLQFVRFFAFDSDLVIEEIRNKISVRIFEICSPICLWFVFDFIDFEKLKTFKLQKHTFFVYSTHYMFLSLVCSNFVKRALGIPFSNLYIVFIVFVIAPIIIYIILLLIGMLLSKLLPKTYSLLTGGR